jgi:hypothetical protein
MSRLAAFLNALGAPRAPCSATVADGKHSTVPQSLHTK